jgi:hypothetical protein
MQGWEGDWPKKGFSIWQESRTAQVQVIAAGPNTPRLVSIAASG